MSTSLYKAPQGKKIKMMDSEVFFIADDYDTKAKINWECWVFSFIKLLGLRKQGILLDHRVINIQSCLFLKC